MSDFQTANAIVDEHYPAGESIRFAWAIDAVMAAIKAEREACAKVCEELSGTMSMFANSKDAKMHNNAIAGCVASIRKRSQ